tara:strand:- start:233 stop:751 length:519 start_codon:yes stop_codon:yes gene_type:complete
MIIYFVKYQLNIFPDEINNIIIQYLKLEFIDKINKSRDKIFYFKYINHGSLEYKSKIDEYYDNKYIIELSFDHYDKKKNYYDLFRFDRKEIDILQHFENIIYKNRIINVLSFINNNSGKLRFFKTFLIYKKLVKEIIKSNWGLNYNIDNLNQYIIHNDCGKLNIEKLMLKYY